MSLRDLLGKKPATATPPRPGEIPAEVAAAARVLDDDNDAESAFAALRTYIASDLAGDRPKAAVAASFALFVRISRALGAGDKKLYDAADAVVADADDTGALLALGYELYEQGLFALGAPVLLRANRITPGDARIVSELATTLEHLFRFGEALVLLESSGLPDRDPMCAYLSGFHAFMCGNVEVTKKRAAQIGTASDESIAFMHRTLSTWIERADALTAAGIDLAGETTLSAWHAAINGTVLLHESPYGWDEPMRGRYAFVADSPALMNEGLERLAAVVGDVLPDRIIAVPDRASRILGAAAAKLFARPLVEWSATGGDLDNAVVVVWDLQKLPDAAIAEALLHRKKNQLLFAHASAWVDPFPYAPDVTTFLYQSVTHPFTGGALTFGDDKKVREAAADARPIEALADEILAARVDEGGASKTELAHVLRIRDALASLPASPKRPRQWAGSRVTSNRFT